MCDASLTQPPDRGRVNGLIRPEQIANSWYQNFVEAICRGPGEHVIRRAIGESGVDARERDEKIDDKARLHTGPAVPHVADRTGR